MNKGELLEYIKLSSIPLRRLGKNKMPIASASCCLIDYKQKKILLTAQHVTGDMGSLLDFAPMFHLD